MKTNLNWNIVAMHGAPIFVTDDCNSPRNCNSPSACTLKKLIPLVVAELRLNGSKQPREKEAFQALLLSIKSQFPSFFAKHCSSKNILAFVPKTINGRIIKLKRQATAVLATYL